ncbi:MAG: DUF362 domain-containing protein [Candidatus Zixiibacteriota bacterium]
MSKVVVVRNTGSNTDGKLEREEYRLMLQPAFRVLSGEDNVYFAVRKYIPRGPVGMKVNCLTGRFFPTPKNLVEALSKLILANTDIDENSIIVWERTARELSDAGYELNASSFGRRCLGTDANGIGYADNFETAGEVSTRISRILTDMVALNINLPVLKDHSIAGLSASLKNMYGAIFNPNKLHDNHCSPYAAHLAALPTIKAKCRLSIIDATRIQYQGGPGYMSEYMAPYKGLIISDDAISADRVALEILEKVRQAHQQPPLDKVGRPVNYLRVAEELGLGTADMNKIELKVIAVDNDGNILSGEIWP